MRIFFFLFSFLLLTNCIAQDIYKDGRYFLRIYDMDGVKFEKGHLRLATDTTLVLYRRNEQVTIPVSEIGFIRTRRSAGHTLLLSAGTVTAIMITGFMATAPGNVEWFGWNAGQGALLGIVAGIIYGTPVALIAMLFKKVVKYPINGQPDLWQEFKDTLQPGGS